jgi:pyridoxamine 5'-phosphate oxidase-like protein
MSRRDQITMGPEELRAFLDEERTVTCATHGPRGWPHLMPLWYLPRDDGIWCWTFAKSQKARNIERDPRATLQVEAGTRYEELRGAMLECDVVVHREADVVEEIGFGLIDRYHAATGADLDARRDVFRGQVPKRIGLRFVARRTVTWDHRKLEPGVY